MVPVRAVRVEVGGEERLVVEDVEVVVLDDDVPSRVRAQVVEEGTGGARKARQGSEAQEILKEKGTPSRALTRRGNC